MSFPPMDSPPQSAAAAASEQGSRRAEHVRVPAETLRAMVEQYRRVLHLLEAEADGNCADTEALVNGGEKGREDGTSSPDFPASDADNEEADQLSDLLKSKIESPEFLEMLGSIHMSISKNVSGDDSTTWDIVTAKDICEDQNSDGCDSDKEEYIVVNQEDIVDGMACFMAAYLLSLKEKKELTPTQLQEVLCKTFSAKKNKSKLRKAWDGSKVIYNVASWSATAIGIYQNPAILQAASVAFWSSCSAISRFL